MAKDSVTIAAEIGKVVSEAQPDVLRALLQRAIELIMNPPGYSGERFV
ncbi:MAG: hypothetical protein FD164_2132 [Nitrospirae bacterium]|nr:MAG: hypothetical protein FD164_2132 [Nitrospirota bacterium]